MKYLLKKTVLLSVLTGVAHLSPADKVAEKKTHQELKTVSGLELYVSPGGNSSGKGTLDDPLNTLEAARDMLRTLRNNQEPTIPSTIYLREGIYRLTGSFQLEKPDSGTEQAPVIYRAFPGEKVRLIGGYQLHPDQFTPISDPEIKKRIVDPVAAEKILEIDLRARQITDYGQLSRRGFHPRTTELSKAPPMLLFVDSKPQQLARWPNQSTVQMTEVIDPGPLKIPDLKTELTIKNKVSADLNPAYAEKVKHLTGGAVTGPVPAPTTWGTQSPDFHRIGGTFSYSYDRPEKWNQADDIWISGVFGFPWEWSYNRVEEVNLQDKNITLAYGEVSGIVKTWAEDFHHFENLMEEIDYPGEYYIDRKNGKLYLYPPDGWSMDSDVTVSTLRQPLINCQNVSFVTFQDFDLGTGRSGGITVNGGEKNIFRNLRIRNVTGTAVAIHSGKDHSVVSCHIHDTGATAVSLGGGDWKHLEAGGNRVSHCEIHDIAFFEKVYKGAVVMGNGSVGNIVEYNRIYDLPHVGIIAQGNNHLIEGNDISRVATDFSDMGAIYLNLGTNPSMRGTIIRRNFFHQIGYGKSHVYAIYPDNQTMGLTIEENIFFDIPKTAILINSGAWIIMRNNLFADVGNPLRISYHSHGSHDYSAQWTKLFNSYDFALMPHGKHYPELLRFFEEDRKQPDTNTFEGNVMLNPNIPLQPASGIQHEKRERLIEKENLILESNNPFVRVKDGSLIFLDAEGLSQRKTGFPVFEKIFPYQ